MKIIAISLGTVFFVLFAIMTTKFWGQSQFYYEYKHPFLNTQITGSSASEQQSLIFYNPVPQNTLDTLNGKENLYLEVAFTRDHEFVLPLEKFKQAVRYYSYEEISSKVIKMVDLAPLLKAPRKVIFNLLENTRAEHEVFMEFMKKMGLEKGENFLVRSEYEAPIKALKELAPALLYGTTKPEILKIVAMQSMYLIEAVTLRADVLVHPLKIRNQNFYNEGIVEEMQRRHKKIIVGPVTPNELAEAQQLKPFGIILNQ